MCILAVQIKWFSFLTLILVHGRIYKSNQGLLLGSYHIAPLFFKIPPDCGLIIKGTVRQTT